MSTVTSSSMPEAWTATPPSRIIRGGVVPRAGTAVASIATSAPMPPLPREFKEPYLGVHFSFAYREKK